MNRGTADESCRKRWDFQVRAIVVAKERYHSVYEGLKGASAPRSYGGTASDSRRPLRLWTSHDYITYSTQYTSYTQHGHLPQRYSSFDASFTLWTPRTGDVYMQTPADLLTPDPREAYDKSMSRKISQPPSDDGVIDGRSEHDRITWGHLPKFLPIS